MPRLRCPRESRRRRDRPAVLRQHRLRRPLGLLLRLAAALARAVVYPDLFSTLLTPKSAGAGCDAVPLRRRPARGRAVLRGGACGRRSQRMREAQHPDYPLTLFYAFKQAESRRTALRRLDRLGDDAHGLLEAGFAVTGTWPMRTERGNRSVAHSGRMPSPPRSCSSAGRAPATRRSRRAASSSRALRAELPEALRTLQHGNIAPVDLAQAAIGPGMAVFSRYAQGARGGRLADDGAHGARADQPGARRDPRRAGGRLRRRHALGGRRGSSSTASNEGPYGEADVLARAKNTSTRRARGCGHPQLARGQGAAAAARRAAEPTGIRPPTAG